MKGLRKGNVNDPKYRKALINTLIYAVYLYDDDTFIIMYNVKGKEYKGKMPDLKEMENHFNSYTTKEETSLSESIENDYEIIYNDNGLKKVCIKEHKGHHVVN